MARYLPPPLNEEVQKNKQEILDAQFEGVPAIVNRSRGQIPPGAMTKQMLIRRTGLTIGEVRILIKRGVLKPVGYNHLGWGYYDETTIAQLKRRVRKTKDDLREDFMHSLDPRRPYEASDGVRVFEMIRLGTSLRDIVVQTGLHPTTVKAINADYEECEGGIYLPTEIVDELNKLPLDGAFPLQTAYAVLEMCKKAARGGVCLACKSRQSKLCVTCSRSGAAGKAKQPAELAPYARIPRPSPALPDDVEDEDVDESGPKLPPTRNSTGRWEKTARQPSAVSRQR